MRGIVNLNASVFGYGPAVSVWWWPSKSAPIWWLELSWRHLQVGIGPVDVVLRWL